MTIQLNVLIRPDAFTPELARFLTHRFISVYLPTETVVDKPQFVVPKVARVYETDHFVVDGSVVDYDTLYAIRKRETGSFKGTAYENAVYFAEIWNEVGSDGHIEWIHCGWKFMTLTSARRTFVNTGTFTKDSIKPTDADYETLYPR